MSIVYLGLGSNLNSPKRQVRRAYQALRQLPRTQRLNMAPLYPNKAWGRKAQPDFCNTVVKLNTNLTPERLLKHCLHIEKQQGRIRKLKWGARIIDIDILLFGNRQINSLELTIPHPGIVERKFVRGPLLLLDPNIQLPDGCYLREINPITD